jgi:hypothetical protein
MKKLIVILFLASLTLAGYSQSPFSGFFKPVTSGSFYVKTKDMTPGSENVWLFRPAISVSAIKLTYEKDTKQWNSASFTSAGFGLGFQHYVDNGGTIYNNVGFNLLLLYTAVPTEQTEAGISLAATISALKFLDFGAGYDFAQKQFFGLMGIKYNF